MYSYIPDVDVHTWCGKAQGKAVVQEIDAGFRFQHCQDELNLEDEEGDCDEESYKDQHKVGWVALQQHIVSTDYCNLCSTDEQFYDAWGRD